MIRATVGILAGVGGGFDADAQAFFNRVTTAGGSLSTTEQDAVNTLVVQMKDDGIWNSMKAIYPMVGASAAACAQNLKSSSFTGTFSAGWTFASTGVTPNGTSAYMDTGFNALSNFNASNAHMAFYSRTQAVNVQVEMGYYDGDIKIFHLRPGSNFQFISSTDSVLAYTTTSDARGFWLNTKRSDTDREIYRNGISEATLTTTDTTAWDNLKVYLGARNENGTPAVFSNKQCAFASIGDGLTDTEASDFYTAVQAFQTTLSRQV